MLSRPEVSKLGLGTVQLGMNYGFTRAKTTDEAGLILNTAVDAGISFIDTAREYGDSEKKIGSFVRTAGRDRVFIATKLSRVSAETAADSQALRDRLRNSAEDSRRALGVDCLDLLQLHQADAFLLNSPVFWEIVSEFKSSGLCRHFGVSVYEPSEIDALSGRRDVDFIQGPFNIFDRRFGASFGKLRDAGIRFVARSVFLKGVVTAAPEDLPEELSALRPPLQILQAVCRKVGLKPSAAALLFAAGQDGVDTAIFGVDTVGELEKNIGALSEWEKFLSIKDELDTLEISDVFLTDPRRWRMS